MSKNMFFSRPGQRAQQFQQQSAQRQQTHLRGIAHTLQQRRKQAEAQRRIARILGR